MKSYPAQPNATAVNRILLAIAVAFLCLNSRAAVVTWTPLEITGAAFPCRMNFTPTNAVLNNGSGLDIGQPKNIPASTNATTLLAGDYTVSSPDAPYRLPFKISVPNTTNTYSINDLRNPPLTYTYTNRLGITKQVLPGSGMTAVTNNPGLPTEQIVLSSSGSGGTTYTFIATNRPVGTAWVTNGSLVFYPTNTSALSTTYTNNNGVVGVISGSAVGTNTTGLVSTNQATSGAYAFNLQSSSGLPESGVVGLVADLGAKAGTNDTRALNLTNSANQFRGTNVVIGGLMLNPALFPNAIVPANYTLLSSYYIGNSNWLSGSYPNARYDQQTYLGASAGSNYIEQLFGFTSDYTGGAPSIDRFIIFDYDPSGNSPNVIRISPKVRFGQDNDANQTALTNLTYLADQTGIFPAANTIVTNGGIFSGNGSGLTDLNAAQLTTGTLPMGRLTTGGTNLQGAVFILNTNDPSGRSYTNAPTLNLANSTGLPAAQLSGVVPTTVRISPSSITNDGTQFAAGTITKGTTNSTAGMTRGAIFEDANTNRWVSRDGQIFTNLTATNITGTIPNANLPALNYVASTNGTAVNLTLATSTLFTNGTTASTFDGRHFITSFSGTVRSDLDFMAGNFVMGESGGTGKAGGFVVFPGGMRIVGVNGSMASLLTASNANFIGTVTATNGVVLPSSATISWGATNTAPASIIAPVAWVTVTNAGVAYKLPLYQ
jgi:hypothetical protein